MKGFRLTIFQNYHFFFLFESIVPLCTKYHLLNHLVHQHIVLTLVIVITDALNFSIKGCSPNGRSTSGFVTSGMSIMVLKHIFGNPSIYATQMTWFPPWVESSEYDIVWPDSYFRTILVRCTPTRRCWIRLKPMWRGRRKAHMVTSGRI